MVSDLPGKEFDAAGTWRFQSCALGRDGASAMPVSLDATPEFKRSVQTDGLLSKSLTIEMVKERNLERDGAGENGQS